MKRALLLLLAVAGCKESAPTATSAGSGSSGVALPRDAAAAHVDKPLREALADAAGKQAIALVLDRDGQLVARSVDGSFSHVLLPGPYSDAFYDLPRDLVWLRDATSFSVLDLRLPEPAKATPLIATPNKSVLAAVPDPIEKAPYWDMTRSVLIEVGGCGGGAGLTFPWAKDGAGQLTGTETLKVVDKAWFAAQEHRATHDLPDYTPRPGEPKLAVGESVGNCHKPPTEDVVGHTECRRSIYFGESPYQLVVVNAEEGCPALKCMLYDAAAKQFSAVPGVSDAGPTCGPFQFDESGTHYLTGDQVCTTTDLKCASVGKHAIGWLDSNHRVDNS